MRRGASFKVVEELQIPSEVIGCHGNEGDAAQGIDKRQPGHALNGHVGR